MVEIRLYLLLEDFAYVKFLSSSTVLLVLVLRHLVPLIEAMNVLKRLRQRTWHLLVQVLVVPFMFLYSVLYELMHNVRIHIAHIALTRY